LGGGCCETGAAGARQPPPAAPAGVRSSCWRAACIAALASVALGLFISARMAYNITRRDT